MNPDERALPTEDQLRELREHDITVAEVAEKTKYPVHVVDTIIRSLRKVGGRPLYGDEP